LEKSDKHVGSSCLVISLIGWGVAFAAPWLFRKGMGAGEFGFIPYACGAFFVAIFACILHVIAFFRGLIYLKAETTFSVRGIVGFVSSFVFLMIVAFLFLAGHFG
jgi:hypothetical protein